MKLNLKRALKLRKSLEAHLAKIDIPTTASLSLLREDHISDPAAVIAETRSQMVASLAVYQALSMILAELRRDIAAQNVTNNIEGILATAADIDRSITLQRFVLEAKLATDPQVIAAEIQIARNEILSPSQDRFGSRPAREISTAVVTKEMKDQAQAEVNRLKREKEALEDRRTAVNANTFVEIADDTAEILTGLGLI